MVGIEVRISFGEPSGNASIDLGGGAQRALENGKHVSAMLYTQVMLKMAQLKPATWREANNFALRQLGSKLPVEYAIDDGNEMTGPRFFSEMGLMDRRYEPPQERVKDSDPIGSGQVYAFLTHEVAAIIIDLALMGK